MGAPRPEGEGQDWPESHFCRSKNRGAPRPEGEGQDGPSHI